MTNQEAIDVLQEKISPCVAGKWKEAVDAAISALQAQDLQPACNNLATDAISRQAAIDALNKMKIYRPLDSDRYVISDCLNKIVNLPPAQPEHTCVGCKHRGKWENEFEYGYPSPCTGCKRRANDNYEQ